MSRVPVQMSRHIVLRVARTWTDSCLMKLPANDCFYLILAFYNVREKSPDIANGKVGEDRFHFFV